MQIKNGIDLIEISRIQKSYDTFGDRLLNRIYDKLIAGVREAGGIKQKLFEFAYDQKLQNMRESNSYTHFLWDRLVFGPTKAKVGMDRCNMIVTGSAPISGTVKSTLFSVGVESKCNIFLSN